MFESLTRDTPEVLRVILLASRGGLVLPIEAERLITLGYPTALGVSLRAYLGSIPTKPKDPSQPSSRSNLILVDPRVDLRYQLTAAGIISPVDLTRLQDLAIVPTQPYWIAVRAGHQDRGQRDMGAQGLTIIEGASVMIHRIDVMRYGPMLLAGSVFKGLGRPCLVYSPWPRARDAYHLVST